MGGGRRAHGARARRGWRWWCAVLVLAVVVGEGVVVDAVMVVVLVLDVDVCATLRYATLCCCSEIGRAHV